jgi:SAM-dependent methyltransferase
VFTAGAFTQPSGIVQHDRMLTLVTRRTCLTTLAAAAAGAVLPAGLTRVLAQARDDRSQWNAIYTAPDFPYSNDHNQFLARMVEGRTPGAALDVGMGRGRNSLFLAGQGWQVTGVDIADEGLRLAAEDARSRGLTINAVHQDFSSFDVGGARWDLIAGIYMGDLMVSQAARLMAGLKPGGLLVIENFARDVNQPARVGGGPLGYEVNQLLTLYSELRIRQYEDTVAQADWGRPGRPVPVVRFAGEKR